MPASNARQVYEANMITFRAFRATIDDLKNHPFAFLGDQTSLVRRVQEWRKTIGHLTMWLQDARAYYEQARPEIVVLLEHAFDSVSEVDRVRNDRERTGILKVADHDFINILLDYIQLLETAFSPDRQRLYSTPDDQGPLKRGQILFRGLHSFRNRLDSHLVRPKPIPAGVMVPNQHRPLPPKPQAGFVRRTQPAVQQGLPARVPPNLQQALPIAHSSPPSSAPANTPAMVPPTTSMPIDFVSAEAPDEESLEKDSLTWDVSWEELEALDRSEWYDTIAKQDAQAQENTTLTGSLTEEPASAPDPGATTSQQLPESLAAVDHPSEPSNEGSNPEKSAETHNNHGPVPAQTPSTSSVVAKEEAPSPSALLNTPPSPNPKSLSRLERRQSQLAAEIIDIDELSDDGSSAGEPSIAARGVPPADITLAQDAGDVIHIDDSDEEDQINDELAGPATDSSSQPLAATLSPHDRPDERQPAIPAPGPSHPFQDKPDFSGLTPHIDPTTDDRDGTRLVVAQPDILPGDTSQAAPLEKPQSMVDLEPMTVDKSEPATQSIPEQDSGDMDVDRRTEEALTVEAGANIPPEDIDMANGEHEKRVAEAVPNGLHGVFSGQNEQSPVSPSSSKFPKDVNQLPPQLRVQLRKRVEEPLLKWYTASVPSMSWKDAKARYDRLSDQEVFDLYLNIKSSFERRRTSLETTNPTSTVPASASSSRNVIQSLAPASEAATVNPPQPLHNSIHPSPKQLSPPPTITANIESELPVLLCASPGTRRVARSDLEFSVSTELMATLARWKSRYTTPVGAHEELRTIELACYAPDSFYPTTEGSPLSFTPNAQSRTWPNAGVLRAFVNPGTRKDEQAINLWLSPPPFSKIDEPLDVSEFIQEGKNTISFVHLGGMESFVFVVQMRKMPPPGAPWSNLLKRVQEFTENAGYQGLLAHLSETIK
ncbi:hypothetical protein RhiJN_18030 [Ceratobasidium sp. AG-Ba]|nr:hypothetical protein RhiJN_18030 [Ceratobasidium sp. AG-Ba]